MIFTTPLLLLALVGLPILWWLLRATPPAPRVQSFPALRLLATLHPREETPARTPWWLLLLRLTAAALIIVGLAGPVLGGGGAHLARPRPVAPGHRQRLCRRPRLARPHRRRAIAARPGGARKPRRGPAADRERDRTPACHRAAARRLAPSASGRLLPQAWGTDRRGAAAAITALPPVPRPTSPMVSPGPADAAFAAALAARGSVTELRGTLPARLLRRYRQPGRPDGAPRRDAGAGRPHRRCARRNRRRPRACSRRPDARRRQQPRPPPASICRPSCATNSPPCGWQTSPGAGSVALLDEAARRRPVGLLTAAGADTPLLGADFYIDRALSPYAEVRRGDIATLLGAAVVGPGCPRPHARRRGRRPRRRLGPPGRLPAPLRRPRHGRRGRRSAAGKTAAKATGNSAAPCPGASRSA